MKIEGVQIPQSPVLACGCRNPRYIYAYSIIDSPEGLTEDMAGLEGASLYTMPYNDIGVALSNLEGKIEIDEEAVMVHEKTLEKLMERYTLLPMRFHTVFKEEDDVISMMERHYEAFKMNLLRLCGKVEMGLKVLWKGEEVRARIIKSMGDSHRPGRREGALQHPVKEGVNGEAGAARLGNLSAGRSLLEEKLRDYKIDKALKQEAGLRIEDIDNMLHGCFADKRYKKLQTENLLLNAAYLVEKENLYHFRERFDEIRSAYCDLRYLLSGPWPPYNFADSGNDDYGDRRAPLRYDTQSG